MSESLKKTLPFIKIVSKLSQKNRSKILKELKGDHNVYNALNEIAHNTLKGNIKLKKPQLQKLKRHKKVLEKLCDHRNRNCTKKRQKLIEQSGAAWPLLISAIPALASLISSLVSRK